MTPLQEYLKKWPPLQEYPKTLWPPPSNLPTHPQVIINEWSLTVLYKHPLVVVLSSKSNNNVIFSSLGPTLYCSILWFIWLWIYLVAIYRYVAKTEEKTTELSGLEPGAEYTVTIQTAVGSGDDEVLSQPQTASLRTSKCFQCHFFLGKLYMILLQALRLPDKYAVKTDPACMFPSIILLLDHLWKIWRATLWPRMSKVCLHFQGDLYRQSWNYKWPNLLLFRYFLFSALPVEVTLKTFDILGHFVKRLSLRFLNDGLVTKLLR